MAEVSTQSVSQRIARQSLPVFDSHHPPAADLIGQCVHCGFCLPTCPTYRLWGEEAESPRGRIYLMKLGLNGEVALNEDFVGHFDRCLGCMACLTSCPSGVQYDKLIEATRSQIERKLPRSRSEKFLRKVLFAMFPYPARLRVMARLLWIHQKLGLQTLLRRAGAMSLLPKRLQAMEALAPQVTSFPREVGAPPAPSGAPRLRVGMLLGCVQRVFFDDVTHATMRVLAAEGCQIIAPEQGCCGALMLHCGEEAAAQDFARRMIDSFEQANVDVIAINAAGCGSAMKEYGHLLRDEPAYAEKAREFAGKCRDISEIFADLEPRAARHPLTAQVAFHDACHLQHAQRITSQPRKLLNAIPGLQLLEIEDPAICCGSAGIYNLLQPQAAQELGKRKAQNVINTNAQCVVSGNPGCSLQLTSSLKSLGKPMPVLHWIQLLDASIRGVGAESLLEGADSHSR